MNCIKKGQGSEPSGPPSGCTPLQCPGFAWAKFFMVQVSQDTGFLGSRIWVHGLGPDYKSSLKEEVRVLLNKVQKIVKWNKENAVQHT